jgi:hypothetical protein
MRYATPGVVVCALALFSVAAASPADAKSGPKGLSTVKQIVVVMMENRTMRSAGIRPRTGCKVAFRTSTTPA